MKKITIIYDFLKELGGLERVMFFQANALSKKYDVDLLFSYIDDKNKNRICRELHLKKTIPIHQLTNGANEILQYLKTFLFPHRIKKFKTDLIISHSFMSSKLAYIKKKQDNLPFIVYLHHPPNFLYEKNIRWVNNLSRFCAYLLGLFTAPLLKYIDKKSVVCADKVISNSEYTKKRVKKIYGIDSEVVYPPISNNFKIIKKNIAKKILNNLGIKRKFILLHGRIIKDKRPDLAIIAFSRITDKKLDLVISGTIEEEKNIENLVKKLKLEDRVKILGRVSEEELIALYNSAECFIMSAPKEDFGLTSAEAMACGCPVVAWGDNAGASEIIKENINGFFAKPYDINDFANQIQKVLNKSWDKRDISKSVKKFSEKSIKTKFIKIIQEVLER